MSEHCHRCHGELPSAVPGSSRTDEDALLFCPRCGAPQILLPEHMHSDPPPIEVAAAAGQTTGALPPPLPSATVAGKVDWRAAICAGAIVAVIGAVLTLLGFAFAFASFLGVLWIMAGGVIALALYARLRPLASVSGRIGSRVGFTAGLLMLAAIGIALAGAGVVLRFGTHSMDKFDEQAAQERRQVQDWTLKWFDDNVQDKDLQVKYAEQIRSPLMNSPEVQAGSALAGLATQGLLLLLFSMACGAFAGRYWVAQARRAGLRRGD
jgi:hypothetical protein